MIEPPKIKICGITRIRDAESAVNLGAWAIGMIFVPKTPRVITPEKAKTIVQTLSESTIKVGVFQNQSISEIREISDYVGLDLLQLHGTESMETCETLGTHRIIKVVPWPTGTQKAKVIDHPAKYLLFDQPKSGVSPKALPDLDAARSCTLKRPRIFLAGGLGPDNVAAVAGAVQPFGIDVASGVESRPGIKDQEKMRNLFRAIGALFQQEVDHSTPPHKNPKPKAQEAIP